MKIFKFNTSAWERIGWENYFVFAESAEEVKEGELYQKVAAMVKENKWNITEPKEITSDDIKIMFHFEHSVPKEILNKYTIGYTMEEIPAELIPEEKVYKRENLAKFKLDLDTVRRLRGEEVAQEIDEKNNIKYKQIVLYDRYPVSYLLPHTYWLQTKYIMFYVDKDTVKQDEEPDKSATLIFEKSILPTETDIYVAIKVGKEMRIDINSGRAILINSQGEYL